MPKKLSKNIDFFKDYKLLAIVSHLKDYTLCYYINKGLGLDLVKYEDIDVMHSTPDVNSFSWYYYKDEISRTFYYLVGNKNETRTLLASQKTVDYFLLIKDAMSDEVINEILRNLRKTPNINAVFDIKIQHVKDVDLLIESVELHELQYVKKK